MIIENIDECNKILKHKRYLHMEERVDGLWIVFDDYILEFTEGKVKTNCYTCAEKGELIKKAIRHYSAYERKRVDVNGNK